MPIDKLFHISAGQIRKRFNHAPETYCLSVVFLDICLVVLRTSVVRSDKVPSPNGSITWATSTRPFERTESGWEIHRALGVTQKTAWFMLHRIRLGMKDERTFRLGGNDGGGPVESDETFVGPNLRRMHKDRRARVYEFRSKHVETYAGKTVVMGMLDRELRRVRAKVAHSAQDIAG
jgi:hypothetical protein